MTGAILDADELAALRAAMLDQLAPGAVDARAVGPDGARPVALIADDRAAETARPEALRLAHRWATEIKKRLQRGFGVRVDLAVEGAEVITGAPLRDSLYAHWTRTIEIHGRSGFAVVAAGGPMIEEIAAILLGAEGSGQSPNEEREPTITALNVFQRAGDRIVAALSDVWREEQAAFCSTVTDSERIEDWWVRLFKVETLLSISLLVIGATSGRLRLIGLPETIAAPRVLPKSSPTSLHAIEQALALVPVEVRVELGRAEMPMSDLTALEVGQVIALGRSTTDLLPLEIAGIVKAFGRPVVAKGTFGLEIHPTPPELQHPSELA